MVHDRRIQACVLAVVLVAAACRSGGPAAPAPVAGSPPSSRFEFGIVGDAPYSPLEEGLFENLIPDANRHDLSFILHVGDIKAGNTACTDDVYFRSLRRFNSFRAPLVYTPGDNDWTDCARSGADQQERLRRLREIFYPTDESLGMRKLRLTRQSTAYPENVRFTVGDVTVLSIHVVGSNDNLPAVDGDPGDPAEHLARKASNLAWLSEGFRAASSGGSGGVVIVMQADPRFERPPEGRTAFNDLLAALERETLAFGKPVVVAHGDTHVFRVDRPLVRADGTVVANLTRVETFGSPDVHWVRGAVDPEGPELFTFAPQMVAENKR